MLVLLIVAILYGSHFSHLGVRIAVALFGGITLGLRGYLKKSLDASGGIAAAVVGAACMASSVRSGATLLAFYFSSTKLTRLDDEYKSSIGLEGHKPGGQRTWRQVSSVAAIPSLLALACAAATHATDIAAVPLAGVRGLLGAVGHPLWLGGAFLGYVACCCGDTWASEVGIRDPRPRLITQPWRVVRAGVNGAVSPLGLLCSALGGLLMGVTYYAMGVVAPPNWVMGTSQVAAGQAFFIPLGLLAGFGGSLLDSLLGATVQYTAVCLQSMKIKGRREGGDVEVTGRDILSNNQVNLVSSLATAIVCGFAALALGAG